MGISTQALKSFAGKATLDKAVNSLVGLIEGLAIDGVINPTEKGLLNLWLSEYGEYQDVHPFNELMPVVTLAVSDGVLDEEERQDILWLCDRLISTSYFNATTAELQVLHGILGGIAADGVVSKEELQGLRKWVDDHDYLRCCWPYDEVDSIITSVLKDGKIDEIEHKALQHFFGEFLAVLDDRTITAPVVAIGGSIQGVCAVCPEINFEDSLFCFTGESSRYKRSELASLVSSLGGKFTNTITQKVSYLVIGAEGNQSWAYACYGRKVEKAIELRKQGSRLLIVHEHDFHDAVSDYK